MLLIKLFKKKGGGGRKTSNYNRKTTLSILTPPPIVDFFMNLCQTHVFICITIMIRHKFGSVRNRIVLHGSNKERMLPANNTYNRAEILISKHNDEEVDEVAQEH